MAKAVKTKDVLMAIATKHGWEFFVVGNGPGRRYIFKRDRVKLRYSRGGRRKEASVRLSASPHIAIEVFYDTTVPDGPTLEDPAPEFIDALLPILTRGGVIEKHRRNICKRIAIYQRDIEMWKTYLDELAEVEKGDWLRPL